jgi:signal peptidase I
MNNQGNEQNGRWVTTVFLAILFGALGIDRFYNRQVGWGLWKLLMLGGFGIWWLSDIIYWSTHKDDFPSLATNARKVNRYNLTIGLVSILWVVLTYMTLQVSIKSYKIFNISELPTLQPGDHIIVNKLSYAFSKPSRGEHIVFYSARHGGDLIKRIIAIPGDRVEIRSGVVYVNGTALVEPYILERPRYSTYEQTVPEDRYFVLGDDRNNSDDSHNGWTVPRNSIVGKVAIIYWPPDRSRVYKPYSSYMD